jgi:hypothetical protein
MAAMLAARGGEAAPARPPEAAGEAPAVPAPKPIAKQRATIAADVARQRRRRGARDLIAEREAPRSIRRARRRVLHVSGYSARVLHVSRYGFADP